MSKNEITRFSPRFNLSDPAQRKAAQYIEVQGKRMAQYITNAVLHYESCPNLGHTAIDYEKLSTMISAHILDHIGSNIGPPTINYEKNDSFLLDGLDAFR